MKTMKKKLAIFMAVLMLVPTMPAAAKEPVETAKLENVEETVDAGISGNVAEPEETEKTLPKKPGVTDTVIYNTGNKAWNVVDLSVSANVAGDAYFQEDGSYTIEIPEANPFFPYEVQFTCDGKVTNEWFMTPDDSVTVGGHTFYVKADFDNTAVTQMSLNVAGDTVVVYPEEKEFTDSDEIMGYSLLPLEEKKLTVDLKKYTPVELTMVSVDELFAGENKLTDTDKLMWKYIFGNDSYEINQSGDKIDLCYNFNISLCEWEMIVGAANQLAYDNTRYIVTVERTSSRYWLTPTVYTQDATGKRTQNTVEEIYWDIKSYNREHDLDMYMGTVALLPEDKEYIGIDINSSVFPSTVFKTMKVFEGKSFTAEEAMARKDISNQILATDMSKKDAGYEYDSSNRWITIVTYGADGDVTGCFPLELCISRETQRGNYISISMQERTENGPNFIVDSYSSKALENGCINYTITLYKEYAVDGLYSLGMTYYDKNGNISNSEVTAAYIGQYSSITEAVAARAEDVKDALFNGGYQADYSKGVYFTVFVGADNTATQKVFKYHMQTKAGTRPQHTLSSSTFVSFSGLVDANGVEISTYNAPNDEDSYGEYNYLTMLVGADTDLTKVAPEFYITDGAKLYTQGSNTPEVSRKSYHDFSKGPVQYTVSAEDGINSKNYWLQIVKATNGAGRLYINSLDDEDSHTREENGVIYSTREIMLDGRHGYEHDIWLANMGTEPITDISAELVAEGIVLDEYWTLKGGYDLAGFSTTHYGELPNLAKIRIKAKDSQTRGEDVSGTLTIKSGDKTLMVLTLTGVIGDPAITTKEIPEAVKYVPYGTMIQNNNKYSRNKVEYSLLGGKLPIGMEIKPNGEIYGVPREAGEFTFTVRMDNSYSSFADSTRTFTLVVNENTDENVEAAVDTGYELTERIQDFEAITNSLDPSLYGSQTLVSQGEYAEFVDIYLDGKKLVEGTDYTSEAGSTRITIQNQTLVLVEEGTHTLGIEFRTSDTDELKRSAQNYYYGGSEGEDGDNTPDNGDNGDNGNGSGNGSNGSGSGSGSSSSGSSSNSSDSNYSSAIANTLTGGFAKSKAAATAKEAVTVSYTIQSGDTLWKIAEEYYGAGQLWQKIFEDNKDVIKDPNKIFAGQVIVIYLNQGENDDSTAIVEGNYYTVQAGDTLYKIAEKFYGKGRRWRKIYQANKSVIKTPECIYEGQVILIPEE